MKFYMAAGRLVGTQAEAKDRDKGFEQHDVPIDKDGLMAYVNNLLEQIDAAKATVKVVHAEPVEHEPAPPPPPAPAPVSNKVDEAEAKRRLVAMLQGMRADEIENKITEAKPGDLARFLFAAICRFGELGRAAFPALQAQRTWGGPPDGEVGIGPAKRVHLTAHDERGLRYLNLIQLESAMPEEEAA